MIKSISLHGFKSYVNQTFELSPLTILTGLNSSGKSSVIQSIRVLKNIVSYKDENKAFYQLNIGDKNEVMNQNCDKIEIKATIDNLDHTQILYDSEIGINIAPFPYIIYISASRKGGTSTIPLLSNLELGSEGENVLNVIEHYGDEILADSLQDEAEGKTFSYVLAGWLQKISPDVKFEPKLARQADTSYSLYDQHRSSNVGYGLSYSLPVIVALLLGTLQQDSLVLIENPEAHLHPRGQYEMSRLICLCVEAGANVLVETHSDHLFDGVRIFCKESEIPFADNVIAYWCQLDEDKCTKVDTCHIKKNGKVDNWPQGMFDQFLIDAEKLI